MKVIISTLFLIFSVITNSFSQESITWHTDIAKGRKLAIEENKQIIVYFTGENSCDLCIEFQNKVLKTQEFKQWAKKHVILVQLESAVFTEEHKKLFGYNYFSFQHFFEKHGYPFLVFLKPEDAGNEYEPNLKVLGASGLVTKGGMKTWLQITNTILKLND